ncbi:hypothetical protein Goarm_022706 [Gossypium armourianum]|uniref:Uncharacterized protein n=1 Tax=Gossypium armourianum TaxID=34283 RepID=A0A7J9KDN2_9ROSI|nr:hypothetical protein [Gossypium armourianum]
MEPDSSDEEITVGPMIIPEYNNWRVRRINDNIPKPSHESSQSMEEHLRAVPSELENRVTKLEGSLYRYQNQNSVMELKASLSKIEEMKERIEELETALQNCEIRIEYLEANEDHQNKQLYHLQNQVRNRDHIMGEAVVQIREVADHL